MNTCRQLDKLRARVPAVRFPLLLGILLLAACGSDDVVRVRGNDVAGTIVADRGQKIDVKLGNVGPATWASPPSISFPVLEYLGVDVVPPYNPGGPTQLFHFRAVASGEAVVTFQRMLGDSLVATMQDTVLVR
ncbi:MAG TPA: hypothetical protein VIR34_06765 [Gemmatimonadaceae bacterium]|jgi:hypothetical protein